MSWALKSRQDRRNGQQKECDSIGFPASVGIVRGDFRAADNFFRPNVFDLVVSNPPYHELGRGRISRHEERAVSRHQMMMPLEDFFRVSAGLLKGKWKTLT